MALQRAVAAIEEDHESYIMNLPEADIMQLISKTDEDGRCGIFLHDLIVLYVGHWKADLLRLAGQVAPSYCSVKRKDRNCTVPAL